MTEMQRNFHGLNRRLVDALRRAARCEELDDVYGFHNAMIDVEILHALVQAFAEGLMGDLDADEAISNALDNLNGMHNALDVDVVGRVERAVLATV